MNVFLNTTKEDGFDFIAIGDSNLAHMSYGITSMGSMRMLLSWAGSCLNLPDYTTIPYATWMNNAWLNYCSNNYKLINKYADKPVILGHNWAKRALLCTSENCNKNTSVDMYFDVLGKQLEKLSKLVGSKRNLYIIGWAPAPKESLVNCTNKILKTECNGDVFTTTSKERLEVNSFLSDFSSKNKNIFFINPFDPICDSYEHCKTVIGGKNLFFDSGHLSAFGSSIIWPYIENEIKKHELEVNNA